MIPAHAMGIERINLTYKKFGDYIDNKCKRSVFKYVSETPLSTNARVLITENSTYNIAAKLLLRFFSGLNDFLLNTNVSWFYRSTDDNLILIDRFIPYIRFLSKKYNPLTDIVVKGEVCGGGFIHGGPGWILSRKAAELIYENKNKFFDANWSTKPDDVHFAQKIKFLNLSAERDIHEGKFIGVDFSIDSLNRIVNMDYNNLIKCSNITNDNKLPYFIKPHHMKKAVVWHGAGNETFPLRHGDKYIDLIPDNIGFYHSNMRLHFCVYV